MYIIHLSFISKKTSVSLFSLVFYVKYRTKSEKVKTEKEKEIEKDEIKLWKYTINGYVNGIDNKFVSK